MRHATANPPLEEQVLVLPVVLPREGNAAHTAWRRWGLHSPCPIDAAIHGSSTTEPMQPRPLQGCDGSGRLRAPDSPLGARPCLDGCLDATAPITTSPAVAPSARGPSDEGLSEPSRSGARARERRSACGGRRAARESCDQRGQPFSWRQRGFRRNEDCLELSAPPGDAVHSESRDLVVLDAVRAHVVDNGLERADRELGRHQPASCVDLVLLARAPDVRLLRD